MAKVNPEEFAEKWSRRLRGSTEDIRRGVNRVTEAPGEAAAKNQEAMLAKVTDAINSGFWAARVRSVSLADWKAATLEKGIARIPSGVEAATPKMRAVAAELLPAIDAAAEMANRLPKVTLEDSIQRMTVFVREMAARAPRKRAS